MKWRLSKDTIGEKEVASDNKSTSYKIKDTNIVLTKLAPPTDAPLHKYKINTNDTIIEAVGVGLGPTPPPPPSVTGSATDHDKLQYRRRLSLEEAFKTSSDGGGDRHSNMTDGGEIFVISSTNQNTQPMPWTTSIATQTTNEHDHRHYSNHHQHQHQHHHLQITSMDATSNVGHMTPTIILDNYASESNTDFHYISSSANLSATGTLNKNGSTAKLLPAVDDQSSKQSKCSIFRGLVLSLCLNMTYSNVVRFPRELEKHGTAFLVPYLVILFLVGLPIILLEVSLGQFLGQGAANSWRASPILKGASVISRFASWLGAIWTSLQAVLAVVYIGLLVFKTVPFSDCVSGVRIVDTGYTKTEKSGQECMESTFMVSVFDSTLYFAFLTMSLIVLWGISMVCTHSSKVFRRTTFIFALIAFLLLLSLTGWEIYKAFLRDYFPEFWPFELHFLADSSLWFNALVQVIFSTNIGFGVLPVITGKFLYKSDAVRTSVVYLCFNLIINALSVTLFIVQFDNPITKNSTIIYPELKPFTAIYDYVLNEADLPRIIPSLNYLLIVIASVVSISLAIYTSSRLMPRHPNYILSMIGLTASILCLMCPDYWIPRLLDSRIVGTLVIGSIVFDLMATTWIYGAKNIYTDLEFSIGRPILKSWLVLWCFAPVALLGILTWWCIDDDKNDLLYMYLPRWAPLIFLMAIIVIIACVEISRQVDYNFFTMICEAGKPAKEWGPADPLARHAWKQWRSVCQDTGQKDFTLRRRGTRDYTHSIKKGQYSMSSKYGTQNWKSSTPGNSSPNYSGSVFGDSAIEEDMSVDKYSGVNQQFSVFANDSHGKPMRYSNRSRKVSQERRRDSGQQEKHKEILYIRRSSTDSNNATKIEITPSSETDAYAIARNPRRSNASKDGKSNSQRDSNNSKSENADHICWRKFSLNSEEYSTEL